MYLSIDPGAKPGFAVLDGKGLLYDVGITIPDPALVPYLIRSAVIELPMIYPGTPAPKANDQITLATRVGRLAERFRITEERMFWPTTWKGSISKETHHPRIFGALNPHEQALLAERLKGISKSRIEDAMDALGLAKWAWENKKF